MAMAKRSVSQLRLLVVMIIAISCAASAEPWRSKNVGQLSVPQIEDALQDYGVTDQNKQCPIVQELNLYKRTTKPEVASYTSQVFEKLFPGTSFAGLSGPAVNALLATLYISGPPNFLLALCPPNIDPSSLSVMVAFAVGGLLGDVLFHLLPEIFLGEAEPDHARFVLVEPNKNLLLGVAIMVGFVTFVAMDKGLRIATGGEGGHDHGHSHTTDSKEGKHPEETSAVASGANPVIANGSLKSRKQNGDSPLIFSDFNLIGLPSSILQKLWALKEPIRAHRWLKETLEEDPNCGVMQIALWKAYEDAFHASEYPLLEAREFIQSASNVLKGASPEVISGPTSRFIIKGVRPKTVRPSAANEQAAATASPKSTALRASQDEPSTSIRLSAYLNLIADFTHNITDGLAMSSSFYASPTLGATTAMAVFFHEIPHEVGDFALLIQSGFSKRKAMGAQFVTAVGAFLGTCIGIAVQELGKTGPSDSRGELNNRGLAGTGLGWGDMLLPFTAGTFLYVGTVAVIPELLETGPRKKDELKKTLIQFVAMAFGAGIMLAISWT